MQNFRHYKKAPFTYRFVSRYWYYDLNNGNFVLDKMNNQSSLYISTLTYAVTWLKHDKLRYSQRSIQYIDFVVNCILRDSTIIITERVETIIRMVFHFPWLIKVTKYVNHFLLSMSVDYANF